MFKVPGILFIIKLYSQISISLNLTDKALQNMMKYQVWKLVILKRALQNQATAMLKVAIKQNPLHTRTSGWVSIILILLRFHNQSWEQNDQLINDHKVTKTLPIMYCDFNLNVEPE